MFLNTIDHAIRTMQDAGILAQADRKDMGDYLEYTVKIPKTGNSSKGRGQQPGRKPA